MANELDILNLEELWNLFKKHTSLDEEQFNEVRFGVLLKFDIVDYFENFNVKVKEKSGRVIIGKRILDKMDINTELIRREQIMYKILNERISSRPIASIRSGK